MLLHLSYKVDGDGFVVQEDYETFLEELYPDQDEVTSLVRAIAPKITKRANDKARGKTNFTA